METIKTSQNVKECKQCHNMFDPKPKNKKFCCIECGKLFYKLAYERSKPELSSQIEKECLNCKTAFRAKHSHYKFCNPKCTADYHNNRFKQSYQAFEWQKIRQCQCGKEFLPNVFTHIYCSPECRNKFGEYEEKCPEQPVKSNTLGMGFTNEDQFAEWFKISCPLFGVEKIIKFDRFFPDARLVINGKILNAELEYYASNFSMHNHEPNSCDLIISYIRPPNTLKIKEIPIFSFYTAIHEGTGFYQPSFKYSCEFLETFNKSPFKAFTKEKDILEQSI
jgi:hypothetical protein